MKGIKQFPFIFFLLTLFSFGAAAQSVSSVTIGPNQYNCNSVLTATIQGVLPNPCYSVHTSVSVIGNYVNIYLTFTAQPGVCAQVVTPFTQNVIIGTLPVGTYTVRCYNSGTGAQIYGDQQCIVSCTGCQAPSSSHLYATNITFNGLRINCHLISGVGYYQFLYRRVGYTTWYSTQASSNNWWNMTGLTSNCNYEYRCRVYCNGGWTYYSPSQYCSTPNQQPTGSTCNNAIILACGVAYSGSSNTGSNNYSNYSFPNGSQVANMTGSEAFHRFTVTSTSNVTINLNSLSPHLFLFLLSNCNSTCNTTSGLNYSCNTGSNNQQLTMSNLAPGTYTVIVDGWQGASCNYNLTLQCTAVAICSAPTSLQCYASNVTYNSVRLNCAAPGSNYDWSYRAPGGNWVELPSTTQNYCDITGLQAGVTYQFLVAVRCNNAWSRWSPVCYCTTPANNPAYNCNNAILVGCGNSYAGNNGAGGNISYYPSYTYNGQTNIESGPESVYKIVVAANASVTINLSGLSGDLDLFLLSSCAGNNSVVAQSGHGGAGNESINMNNLPAGTYYIVVDGWNGCISNFLLSIVCNNNNICYYDECCVAQTLYCYNTCTWVNCSNVGASPSYNGTIGGCSASGMQDVWYAVQMPSTGRMRVTTGAGTMTNAVLGIYGGSACSSVNCYGCVDNVNGSLMPDVIITGSAGVWIYLRVWGYGGSVGTFKICITILSGYNAAMQANDEVPTFDLNADIVSDRTDKNEDLVVRPEVGRFSLSVFPVPAQGEITFSAQLPVDQEASIRVFDLNGRLVKEMNGLQSVDGNLQQRMPVDNLPVGLYIVQVRSGAVELSSKFSKI